MASSNELAQDLEEQRSSLKSLRQPFETEWENISDYMLQRPIRFSGSTTLSAKDLRPPENIVVSTARDAVQIFAAGMLSGVSSPSSEWFRFVAKREDQYDTINEDKDVAMFCEYLTGLLQYIFVTRNYYGQQVQGYQYLGTIGHQCLFITADKKTGNFIFRCIPIEEVCFAEDASGFVNVVFRDINFTGAQILQTFGEENLSKSLQDQLKSVSSKTQIFPLVHAVIQKEAGYENLMGSNKLPFASYFYEPDSGHLIEESGYNTIPYIVTRASTTYKTPYSSSFGLTCLSDCRMLNEMLRIRLQAAQLGIAPPLIAPDNKRLKDFSYSPWAINAYNKLDGYEAGDFMPLNIGSDPRLVQQAVEETVMSIRAAFNVDMFLMIQQRTIGRGTPTAQEVAGLQQEKAFILGPLLNNLQHENFNRTFQRCYDLMQQLGQVPEAPRKLMEQGITLEYLSPLMMSQRQQKAASVVTSVAEILSVAGQMNQESIDNVNLDVFVRDTLQLRGVPATYVRPSSEVEQIRQQRIEAMQQQQQMAMQQHQQDMLPDAYAKTTKAPEPGSLAEQVAQAATTQGVA